MRLGELLLEFELVTTAELETALEGQILHGARLGTNLVERRFLNVDDLGGMLGKQHGMRPAVSRDFAQADSELQRRLPTELAARWHAIPLRRGPGGQVAIAVTDPVPAVAEAELADCLDAEIVQWIAPELRILYGLEKIYGIERLNRFIRIRPITEPPPVEEQRRYVQSLRERAPEPPNALARVAVRKIAVPVAAATAAPRAEPPIDSKKAGLKAMRRALDRNSLGVALTKTIGVTLVPPFAGVIAFIVRSEMAAGWTGLVDDGDASVIEALALEIAGAPTIDQAVKTGTLVRGNPPESPAFEHMWSALQIDAPSSAVAVPIKLDTRTVAVLYGFNDWPMEDEVEDSLVELADALATHFIRLLRAAAR